VGQSESGLLKSSKTLTYIPATTFIHRRPKRPIFLLTAHFNGPRDA
jgi:hypothetical protein